MKPKPFPKHLANSASAAIYFLRIALETAKAAESPKLVARIRSAIKSADGARRHAELRVIRLEPEFPVSQPTTKDTQ